MDVVQPYARYFTHLFTSNRTENLENITEFGEVKRTKMIAVTRDNRVKTNLKRRVLHIPPDCEIEQFYC